MLDRTPSGTRDVLPDEMRELRALMERVREVFERAGYGEIYTPALEYERTFAREGTRVSSPYRLFDEHGNVLVLRSDMTVPIARMVGSRYPVGADTAALLLLRARLPRRAPAAWSVSRGSAGRGRADRRARTRGHRRGADRAL